MASGGAPQPGAAVPEVMPIRRGDRDPRGQREWARAVWAEGWVGERQGRVWDRLRALLRELAVCADWATHLTAPGWDRLVEVTGWSRRRLAEWLRQLRLCGWLELVEHGSTPEFRPMSLADDIDGNRRAVYRLRVPVPLEDNAPASFVDTSANTRQTPAEGPQNGPSADPRKPQVIEVVDKNRTPSFIFSPPSNCYVGGSYARETNFPQLETISADLDGEKTELKPLRGHSHEKSLDFREIAPVGAGQMHVAAAQLRRVHPILARLSVRHVRALLRPFWRASWTNRDVLVAMSQRPGSARSMHGLPPNEVQFPAAWTRSRLSAWLDDAGRVLPSPTSWSAAVSALRQHHGRAGVHVESARPRPVTVADVRRRAARLARAARQRAVDAAVRRAALTAAKPSTNPAASDAARAAAVADYRRTAADRRRAAKASALADSLHQAHAHLAAITVAPRRGDALRAAALERARRACGEQY